MAYYLKQYDYKLMRFDILSDAYGLRIENININEELRYLLPLNLEIDSDGIIKWLKSRSIPKNREFVDRILSNVGLDLNNIKGIIDICKGLSLNDSYWVCEEGFNKTFSQVNLYDNKFNNILALIAFTGYGSSDRISLISSPELTTNGMLAKCWRRIDGKIYLFKAGTSGFANAGLEPYSEYYASLIAKTMNIEHVDYNLSKWKGKICSVCQLFCDKNYSYMPIGYIAKNGGFKAVLDYIKRLGESFYQDFLDMLVFDAIIINTDRHYGNFGFIIENESNKIIKMAPLFDNGASLLCYGMDEFEFKSFESLNEYANRKSAVMYTDFISVAKELMTKRQIDKIKKMIGFKFKKHSRYNLTSKRLNLLERIIQERILKLLN